MKNLRFLHIVMIAVSALLLLKILGLATGTRPTGTVPAIANEGGHAEGEAAKAPPPPPPAEAGRFIEAPAAKTIQDLQNSTSEQQLLQSLAKRREELEKRSADLDVRAKLLEAAQQKLDDKLSQMKKISADLEDRQKADAAKEEAPGQQLLKTVAMYEQMKPKDAAAIFEKLDPQNALQLIKAMNPRKVSPILAAMTPDLASKLTAMMTRHKENAPTTDPLLINGASGSTSTLDPALLPKIGANGLGQ